MKTEITAIASVAILTVASFAAPLGLQSVTNAESVITYLAQFPYPGTNVTSFGEFDFDGRQKAIVAILEQDDLVLSTNVLFAVADYLSSGTPVSTDSYRSEILAAHKEDRFAEFGDSNHMVRAGSAYFGPHARVCRQQYEYRRAYNYDLCDFRKAVLKELYKRLCLPPWRFRQIGERNALWIEIRRRVNPSQEECANLPETLGED